MVTEEERFERAIDAVLTDRSPRRAVTGLSHEHRLMLRFVQLLRGSRGQEATPELIARLFPLERLLTRRCEFPAFPCHGAEFDLRGNLRYGPRKYGLPLPPLPPLRTRVRAATVEVFGV